MARHSTSVRTRRTILAEQNQASDTLAEPLPQSKLSQLQLLPACCAPSGSVLLGDFKCSQCQQTGFRQFLAAGFKNTQPPGNFLQFLSGELRLFFKAKGRTGRGQTGLAMGAARRSVRLRRCPQGLDRFGQMTLPCQSCCHNIVETLKLWLPWDDRFQMCRTSNQGGGIACPTG